MLVLAHAAQVRLQSEGPSAWAEGMVMDDSRADMNGEEKGERQGL